MTRPAIDPALGLDLIPSRTLERQAGRLSVIVPAHNEAETIAEVVTDAFRALELLKVEGEVLVSASGCTDATASLAVAAGARVVEAPIGKGAAVRAGLAATDGEVVCLVDGDVRYFGEKPLVAIVAEPILHGIADVIITDLYWRPLYPQMWLYGFFAPLAGYLFPELLPKAGSTPWSGQRAALRHLWPSSLPDGFTVDLELLLHWNRHALRLRPVLADDWVNPQRPKPDLMAQELDVVVRHAVADGRISDGMRGKLAQWYESVHLLMAQYRPDVDQPQDFEQTLLMGSMSNLRKELAS